MAGNDSAAARPRPARNREARIFSSFWWRGRDGPHADEALRSGRLAKRAITYRPSRRTPAMPQAHAAGQAAATARTVKMSGLPEPDQDRGHQVRQPVEKRHGAEDALPHQEGFDLRIGRAVVQAHGKHGDMP